MINMSIEFAHKMSLAYSATCKTLCRELKLPQTAFAVSYTHLTLPTNSLV